VVRKEAGKCTFDVARTDVVGSGFGGGAFGSSSSESEMSISCSSSLETSIHPPLPSLSSSSLPSSQSFQPVVSSVIRSFYLHPHRLIHPAPFSKLLTALVLEFQ
jgi:hypothetical protein